MSSGNQPRRVLSRRAVCGGLARSAAGLAAAAVLGRAAAAPGQDLRAVDGGAYLRGRYGHPSLGWNALACRMAGHYRWDPPLASRAYAYLAMAQHDAVDRAMPFVELSPMIHMLRVGRASASLVAALWPEESRHAAAKQDRLEASCLRAGMPESIVAEAVDAGRRAAADVLARVAADGADREGEPYVAASGEVGRWLSAPDRPPLRPSWGEVLPLLVTAPDELMPDPPPWPGSAEFAAALAEVRRFSDGRTKRQARIAAAWADGPGTPTPPGHWNLVASDLVIDRALSDFQATSILALMNMAMMDAGIVCWRAKYRYALARPSQMDPAIVPSVGLPNFPAYPSGHATFSGAASEVLGYFFPDARGRLAEMAEEAAQSRVYGGIHYRFDGEAGLVLGRRVGRLALGLVGRPGRLFDRLVSPAADAARGEP